MMIRSMSDAAICEAIGRRLQRLRLNRNMSFAELSSETGVSRQTLHALLNEGKGSLATAIAVMRALKDLDSLTVLVEELPLSPIQLHKLKGEERKRATGTRKPAQEVSRSSAKDLDW